MIRALRQRFCRHKWGPWRPGMLQSMSENAGDTSDEAWELDRQAKEALGVKGLPGLGVSEEDDESIEHRVCPKCGNFDVRYGRFETRGWPERLGRFANLKRIGAFVRDFQLSARR
jgi:hypothetical protein